MASVSKSGMWDASDDWTDVTDATERRKLQSRLAQRARRRRKHQERMASSVSASGSSTTHLSMLTTGFNFPPPSRDTQQTAYSNTYVVNAALTILVQRKLCFETQEKILGFLTRVFKDWIFRLPNPADLPTLTRLNALDALVQNALVLQIPFELLETDEYNSRFNVYGPQPALVLPPCLSPTAMQKTVVHHSWLDLFPIPRMRDNILWGIQTGQLNEDQLCNALCCDLLNLTADSASNLVIWGKPWDITGWEFSESFFKMWGTLLYGCPEVLQATNYWRALRGERSLTIQTSGSWYVQ